MTKTVHVLNGVGTYIEFIIITDIVEVMRIKKDDKDKDVEKPVRLT